MTPAIASSTNAFSLVPATTLTTRKNNCLTRCSILRKSSKQTLAVQKHILPLSTSVILFSKFRGGCKLHFQSKIHLVSATETDVAIQESDSPVADGDSSGNLEVPADAAETSENSSLNSDAIPAPARSKRSRPVRKSEMPPVNNDLLVPGATFTGKVRSIQPFGAFVDFGAFTDGLVHVSQLSDSFVKDVASVVSVGQEVKVRLVEANMDTGRISLTMRSSDDIGKLQQQKDAPSSSDKTRSSRKSTRPNQKKDEVRKSSKFVKGQDLEGTVKNLTRSGAFISLPEGEEGFLPTSEEGDEGFGNVMGSSSLQVGQEVSVRVLRINRGQVTLTMKKEDDFGALDANVVQGVVHAATNPFVLAFRRNKELAEFLDEREKEEEPTEDSRMPEISGKGTTVDQIESMLDNIEVQAHSVSSKDSQVNADLVVEDEETSAEEVVAGVSSSYDIEVQDQSVSSKDSQVNADLVVEDDETSAEEVVAGVSSTDEESLEGTTNDEDLEKSVSDSLPCVDGAVDSIKKEAEVNSEASTPEANAPVVDEKTESLSNTNVVENNKESDSSFETASQTSSAGSLVSNDVTEEEVNVTIAKDEMLMQTPSTESSIDSVTLVERTAEPEPQTNGSITSSNEQSDVFSSEETSIKESWEVGVDNTLSEDLVVAQAPAADSAATIEGEKSGPLTGEGSAGSNSNSTEQNSAPTQEETTVKATISPALVKQLREETGAGMMDCKRALSETGGDIVKAQEYLRKKGLASADRKASRATAEGRIGSYIHDSRIGVLIEVNCETDFVSRGDIFKELVDDLAMQVAACSQVQYLVTDDVPKEVVDKEREIEMQKEDLLSKPEQIRSKIVEGRIRKRLEELALLEQPYIKNDKIVVKDWVKQTIATIGENIKVNRFVRYNLGEGLEKKSQDFAAEVAAQTTAKPMPSTVQEQSAVIEAKETVEKPQKAAVSAALVKQLREETGVGMMDCKKALSETGGDLEKAQEYLRKKGLSTADKKSSRLAAEGRIGSYIHDSRIGVLIEVNCETDFVGRSENFKELVDDLAMQVVACPQVQYVSIEDIPESIVNKEKELEMQREDLLSKPENIRERIIDGRVSKRLGELALLEQPFIKNDSLLVKDLVKQTVAALGENIKVRRFVRFTLGETNTAKVESEA